MRNLGPMVSCAMCPMQRATILSETGYNPAGTPPRPMVQLTNSPVPAARDVPDLFKARLFLHLFFGPRLPISVERPDWRGTSCRENSCRVWYFLR